MKALPLSVLAALCAALLSDAAAAQVSIQARLGRNVSARVSTGVVSARHDHDHGRGASTRHQSQRGRWETVCEQVLVPGYWKEEHVPARYGWIYSGCGHRHWGLIDRGGCRRVWVPERYETRHRRVWVRC
ncbi:MAG: hypothetical protein H6838_00175 [Planctomycetes bacterium]|nr:hypothetical protein [Planctomycetota bacterium]MCB9883870.1 hypothetical protein [Planctomycetota bacterium]